ncbi:MAG: arsenate reductase (azurin) small subunit [Acidimicrobiia bacterium]
MAGLTRREFLLIGAAGGAAAAVGVVIPLTREATEEEITDVGGGDAGGGSAGAGPTAAVVSFFPKVRVASLRAVKTDRPVTFEYPLQGQRNVLVKLGTPVATGVGPDEDIVAYSQLCTHMGCLVEEYRPEHRTLGPCPCHFSTFDLAHDGMVTLGQATQNLPQVVLTVEDDDLYAVGVIRLVYGFASTLEGASTVEVG